MRNIFERWVCKDIIIVHDGTIIDTKKTRIAFRCLPGSDWHRESGTLYMAIRGTDLYTQRDRLVVVAELNRSFPTASEYLAAFPRDAGFHKWASQFFAW